MQMLLHSAGYPYRLALQPHRCLQKMCSMELLNSTPVSVIEIRTGTRRDPILSQAGEVCSARLAQLQFR